MNGERDPVRFVRFRGTGGVRLVHLSAVVEVIPMVRLVSREHDGNDRYCGILHFRGRVVPVFDLERADATSLDSPDHFLIVTRRGQRERERAIVASEIDDIIEVEAGDCATFDAGGPHPVEVVDVGGELIEVVDPERLAQ